jgi:peptidyl-tRNA hydrolase ICT1
MIASVHASCFPNSLITPSSQTTLCNLAAAMLHLHVLKSFPKSRSRNQLGLLQDCRAYSSRSSSENDVADLDAAREWFRKFNKSTIPEKIAKTEFSRSGGAGGQKVNK